MKSYKDTMWNMFFVANGNPIHMQDGKAWDNRKSKMCKRHLPRGRVFRWLEDAEWRMLMRKIDETLDKYGALDKVKADVLTPNAANNRHT